MRRQTFFGAALALVTATACAGGAWAQSSAIGQWTGVQTWPVEAIHTTLLPTGKVLFWQSWRESVGIWNPANNGFEPAGLPFDSNPSDPNDPPDFNPFCSGHAWLADGRLLVAGGHIKNAYGDHRADIYNPFTNKWANVDSSVPDVPDMGPNDPTDTGNQATSGRRWYPSATTLGNGDVLVLSGDVGPENDYGRTNRRTQIYRAATNTWQTLSGALRPANDLLPEYPRMFLMPDGRAVSLSDASNDTEFLNLTGNGSWSYLSETPDPGFHNYGPSVMYDVGKIAQFGGGDNPTKNISVLDVNQPNPQWTYAPQDMAQPRRQNNATILADGTVLITGGTYKSGFNDNTGFIAQAELWNPETMTVTPMASASSVYRGYHSNGLLLPDGRVLVSGGNHDNGFENKNAEIYSPPYLFKGPRPTVTAAPDVVELGDTIFVETPNAASIAKALMIIPGSTTHAQNWTQRINHLDFSVTEGGLNIELPADGNHAPPGYYMLFLVNEAGVPSVAEWMRAELPDSADFDGNGMVDGVDLLSWQRKAFSPAGPAFGEGDANGDGAINAADLTVWQSQFGAEPAAAGAGETVPEPRSLVAALVGIGTATFSAVRRRRAM